MNILIDPYMLDLKEEIEIKNNIFFFQMLYYLCKENKIKIYLYKGMLERMLEREIKPFPIFLGKIKDDSFREKVKVINNLFEKIVMNNITSLDIEVCGGTQDYCIIDTQESIIDCLSNDDRYYEMLSVILQPCYNEQINLYECIITGATNNSLKINDEFTIRCICDNGSYKGKYRFGSIDELADQTDRAYIILSDIFNEGKTIFVQSPIIERGKHHNKLQKNSDFTTFEGLSRVNKSVLKLLRRFGLSKIIFGEFHEDTSFSYGTIIIYDVISTDINDIVSGWLYAETGFKNHVKMYFPKEIGGNLKKYFKNELNRNGVQRLLDSLM